jgi:hypothetical protein
MFLARKCSWTKLFAAATLCSLLAAPHRVRAEAVEAEFRGCSVSLWCEFRIDVPAQSLARVRPNGLPRTPVDQAQALALRDRLNALLANMIHQAKRIELHELRELDDGTFSARITIHGMDVALDPLLRQLRE